MLSDVKWAFDGTYMPDEEFSPERFFNDGLSNSTEFDLQLGYFSSAAISVLAESFATFISRGGKMRLVINQMVSHKDKEAIIRGFSDEPIDCIDLSNFKQLKETFDEYQQHFFNCLAYMIQTKVIDIRIIQPLGGKGIAHTKSGQFRDGESITSFTGSANFTVSGLCVNYEEIKIDRSDSVDAMVQRRIEKQKNDFDAIMFKEKSNVEYLLPSQLIEAVSSEFGSKDIEELLDVEKKLKAAKERQRNRRQNHPGELAAEDFYKSTPHFPFPSGPRDYQKEALKAWKHNRQKGLFAMATGTGKTLTALNCLLEIYKQYGFYKAIILVPTITLASQWEQECKKFNFKNTTVICSKSNSWKASLESIKMQEDKFFSDTEPSYIIIITYASFSRDNVFYDVVDFPKKVCKKILLIADEAHNMGARSILNKIDGIKYARRIGLSATPERQYDDEGNSSIMKFFGCENGYTFVFSMREAIEKGFLCRYYYYPHVVSLTNSEMSEYARISLQLAKFFDRETNSLSSSDDIVMRLLLKRKRIIHKARNKEEIFRNVINERFREKGNLKYTLVYVPEGAKPDGNNSDVYDMSDDIDNDDFADSLIDIYSQIVKETSSTTTVKKFTSGLKERDDILEKFASGEIEVLTSMKCLDEGVDVPRSELAIFCSSTGNPRQFIQRRGRILRKHPDKKYAEIHDLVVVPHIDAFSENYDMERSLIASELKRVKDFAGLSENSDFAYRELEEILNYYELSIY